MGALDRSVSVKLKGGYGTGFEDKTGYSTVNGTAMILSGTATVERIVVY